MKNLIYASFIALLFISCATENQQKALDEVAAAYEAKTAHSKGFSNEVGKPKMTYFKITASESALLDQMDPSFAANNIAIIVLRNMTEEEKSKFSHIEVEILKQDGSEATTKNYEVATLEGPAKQYDIFEDFSNKLLNEDYLSLGAMIDPQFRKEGDIESVKAYVDGVLSENGKMISYRPTEFSLQVYKNQGIENYEYRGVMLLENGEEMSYIVETYSNPSTNYVYFFNIK